MLEGDIRADIDIEHGRKILSRALTHSNILYRLSSSSDPAKVFSSHFSLILGEPSRHLAAILPQIPSEASAIAFLTPFLHLEGTVRTWRATVVAIFTSKEAEMLKWDFPECWLPLWNDYKSSGRLFLTVKNPMFTEWDLKFWTSQTSHECLRVLSKSWWRWMSTTAYRADAASIGTSCKEQRTTLQ